MPLILRARRYNQTGDEGNVFTLSVNNDGRLEAWREDTKATTTPDDRVHAAVINKIELLNGGEVIAAFQATAIKQAEYRFRNTSTYFVHFYAWCGIGSERGSGRIGLRVRKSAGKINVAWTFDPNDDVRPWDWGNTVRTSEFELTALRPIDPNKSPGVFPVLENFEIDRIIRPSGSLQQLGLSVIDRPIGFPSDHIEVEIAQGGNDTLYRPRFTASSSFFRLDPKLYGSYPRIKQLAIRRVAVEYERTERGSTVLQPRHWFAVAIGSEKTEDVAELWNERVKPNIRSLRTARPDERFSPLPMIQTPADGKFERDGAEWAFLWNSAVVEDLKQTTWKLDESTLVGLAPISKSSRDRKPAPGETVVLEFAALREHTDSPLRIEAQLARPIQLARSDSVIQFAAKPVVSPTRPRLRMGSLDFVISGLSTAEESGFALGWEEPDWQKPSPITSHLHLNVASVIAGGQDDTLEFEEVGDEAAGSETRESPIVVPLPAALVCLGKAPVQSLAEDITLEIVEELLGDRDSQRRIEARLHSTQATRRSDHQVAVLDTEPFLVAMVQTRIVPGGSGGGAEFAIWRRTQEGTGWAFEIPSNDLDILLPPQVLGEETIRGREITEAGKQRFETRFSPTMRATLRASERRQLYQGVPWNLRRVLGFEGQWPAGSQLKEIHYELLYGMNCEARPAFVRLAETGALLGAVATPLPTDAAFDPQLSHRPRTDIHRRYEEYARDWLRLRSRYRSRLAVFEPWDERNIDEDGTGLPRQLTLSEGVTCRFREGEQRRPPIPGPREDQFPNDKPNGLAGGATWGFEVAPVFNATVREPNSSSALLARPAFSTLGGWGFQKIGFDGDRTTIYSDTSMGRTSFYSIERLGRIGVFWHPAKHVVVYERTVARTTQFQDDQDPFRGAPVLRKVREYVEILQPLRKFPDSGAPQNSCGPITAVEFKSVRINVDHRWGSNVPGYGWRLPLWNPGLPIDQIAVDYPKPQILFHLAAAGDPGMPDTRAGCREPENVYFFTSTQDLGNDRSNTDKWPPVPGVDFDDLPGAWVSQSPNKPAEELFVTNGPPRARFVEPPTPLGFSRFTFELDRGERAIDITSARTSKPIGAALRNVTCFRGTLREQVPGTRNNDINKIIERLGGIDQAGADILNKIQSLAATGAAGLDDVSKACTALRTRLNTLKDAAQKSEAIDTLVAELQSREEALAHDFRRAVVAVADEHLKKIDGLLTIPPKDIAAMKAVATQVEAYLLALQSAAENVPIRPDAALNAIRVQTQAIREAARIAGAAGTASGEIAETAASLRTKVAGLRNLVAGGTVPGLPAGGAVLLIAAAAQVDRALGEIETLTGTEAQAKLRELSSSLIGLATNLETKAEAVATWMSNLIESSIRELRKEIAALPGKPVEQYQKLTADVRQSIQSRLNLGVDAVTTNFTTALNAAVQEAIRLAREIYARVANGTISVVDHILAQTDSLCAVVDSKNLERIAARGNELLRGILDEARRSISAELDKLPRLPQPEFAIPTPVMNLVRAFGDPPKLPQLDFSDTALAYFFDPLSKAAVQISPALALVDRAIAGVKELKPISTNLPIRQLQDWLGPIKLDSFQVSDILPDFGGLDLRDLFKTLKLPTGSNEQVRVAHGVDPVAQKGWVTIDVDVPFPDSAEVFKFGPLAFQLERNAHFIAHTRIDAAAGSAPQRTTDAKIFGNWQLVIGGTPMVTFVDTALRYDGSKISFNVSPDRLRLNPALSFVSELAKKYSTPDSGFTLTVLPEGGAEARLDLPIPDTQGVTSGVSGLRVGALMALRISDPAANGDFSITLGFSLGARDKPFNVAIFILGGSGFAQIEAKYVPKTKALTCAVHTFISLSASLAVAFGPIRGGVFVYLGVTLDYESGGAAVPLTIGILVIVRGEVSILNIVSASICLSLQGMYRDGVVIGRGRLQISIRICWCFELNIDESVEWQVGSSSSGALARPEALLASAEVIDSNVLSDSPRWLSDSQPIPDSDPFDELAARFVRMFAR